MTSRGSAGANTRCFSAPPREWLVERIATIQTVLERRTERSALLLRKLLGPIRMEPVKPDIGRPYYRARSNLDVLAIVETTRTPQILSPVRLLCDGGGGVHHLSWSHAFPWCPTMFM